MSFIEELSLPQELWEKLLGSGRSHAARGLLHDLFDELTALLEYEVPPTESPDTRELFDKVNARMREVLMSMIDDQDGNKLRTWLQLFRTDRVAFDMAAKSRVEEAALRPFRK
jgi:hypothetical protein